MQEARVNIWMRHWNLALPCLSHSPLLTSFHARRGAYRVRLVCLILGLSDLPSRCHDRSTQDMNGAVVSNLWKNHEECAAMHVGDMFTAPVQALRSLGEHTFGWRDFTSLTSRMIMMMMPSRRCSASSSFVASK